MIRTGGCGRAGGVTDRCERPLKKASPERRTKSRTACPMAAANVRFPPIAATARPAKVDQRTSDMLVIRWLHVAAQFVRGPEKSRLNASGIDRTRQLKKRFTDSLRSRSGQGARQERRPIAHHLPPLFDHVAAGIGLFHLGPELVPKGGLRQIPVIARVLTCPNLKRTTRAMRDRDFSGFCIDKSRATGLTIRFVNCAQ